MNIDDLVKIFNKSKQSNEILLYTPKTIVDNFLMEINLPNNEKFIKSAPPDAIVLMFIWYMRGFVDSTIIHWKAENEKND